MWYERQNTPLQAIHSESGCGRYWSTGKAPSGWSRGWLRVKKSQSLDLNGDRPSTTDKCNSEWVSMDDH